MMTGSGGKEQEDRISKMITWGQAQVEYKQENRIRKMIT